MARLCAAGDGSGRREGSKCAVVCRPKEEEAVRGEGAHSGAVGGGCGPSGKPRTATIRARGPFGGTRTPVTTALGLPDACSEAAKGSAWFGCCNAETGCPSAAGSSSTRPVGWGLELAVDVSEGAALVVERLEKMLAPPFSMALRIESGKPVPTTANIGMETKNTMITVVRIPTIDDDAAESLPCDFSSVMLPRAPGLKIAASLPPVAGDEGWGSYWRPPARGNGKLARPGSNAANRANDGVWREIIDSMPGCASVFAARPGYNSACEKPYLP